MNFNQAKEQFNRLNPEMKAQMMQMAKERIKEKITHWFTQPAFVIIAIFVGLIVGILTAFLGDITDKLSAIRTENFYYFIIFLPIICLAIFYMFRKWGKWSERGMDLTFDVATNKENHMPIQGVPLIILASFVSQLFGGSVGRLGTAMQIGSTISYNLSKKLPFENSRFIMIIIGIAAGFAGIFQAPMAATAFALEVLLIGHFEYKAILPTTVSAFTASYVSTKLGFHAFHFDLSLVLSNNINLLTMDSLLKFALFGILCGIIGGGFAKILKMTQNYFAKKYPNPIKRILILGIIVSVVLILFQGKYAGLGVNLIDMSFNASDSIKNYDWILKFIITILSLSAGLFGGFAMPLFSIGATFGIFMANLLGIPMPLACALGFVSVFAGATNTIFAPIFIAIEFFGCDYMGAFFISCVLAYSSNQSQSVYKQKKIRIKL